MSEQIITKQCSHGKEIKPVSEFSKDKNRNDGLFPQCKSCHTASMRLYRRSEKGKATHLRCRNRYSQKYPERVKSASAVNSAIRASQLPRPDTLKCHYCPAQAKEYHHYLGYEPEHWLDIEPVCSKCHRGLCAA